MPEDTYMFNLRMSEADKKKLKELAKTNSRSMSSQIVWMIRQDWIKMKQADCIEGVPVAIEQVINPNK